MRGLPPIIAVAGSYALLRGWHGCPSLLLRSCLAVATLTIGLACWRVRRSTTATTNMRPATRATWLDYLTLGTTILLAKTFLVVITSNLAVPAQNLANQVHLLIGSNKTDSNTTENHNTNNTTNGNPNPSHRAPADWVLNKNIERLIPPNNNFKPSNKPEIFIELQNTRDATTLLTSRIHLRSFVFSRFNGSSWSAAPAETTTLTAPITFPDNNTHSAITYTVYHAANPTGKNLFTALPGTISTNLPELTRLREDIHLLPPLAEPANTSNGYSYTATSRSIHFTDVIGPSLIPAPAAPGELDLPADLAEQLKKTSEEFAYEPDLTSQLIALRNFLRDHHTYSLTTKNPSGTSPLENFLYHEKRGYCEHFATAAAMLCRTLGIPSRIAYGWSGGRLYTAQNMFVFRAKDAHAWTEIKLTGYGWVVFDTTPPDDDATPEAHAAPENEPAPDPRKIIAQQQQTPIPPPTGNPTTTLGIRPNTLYTVIAVIAICATTFLVTRLYKRPPTSPNGHPLASPPPNYMVSFKQACATHGQPMPPGRTLRQQIHHLKSSEPPPPFADKLLAYHYGTVYDHHSKNPRTEKFLLRAIRKWKHTTH